MFAYIYIKHKKYCKNIQMCPYCSINKLYMKEFKNSKKSYLSSYVSKAMWLVLHFNAETKDIYFWVV